MVGSDGSRRDPRWGLVVVALVYLVALNLRPALTSVGPLLPQIGDDKDLGEGLQGLLGALPLLAFAAASPLVHRLSKRVGADRAVLLALIVLAAGIGVRSGLGTAGLWLGTVVLGAAIAVGNVLVPALVKRDFSRNISLATGVYTACIVVAASTASAVAVPVSEHLGWRGALAVWAVPAVVVAAIWFPRARRFGPDPLPAATDNDPPVSVWRQPMAWFVTAFMGLQSTTFYVMVTWLPTIEVADGATDQQAGLHLFAFQIIGIVSGLAVPRLMRNPDTQVTAALTSTLPMLFGVLGLLFLPQWSLAWALLAGTGSGASLVVALSIISLRGRSHHETTQLSGMAQSVGYLLAAAGPLTAGLLAELTGSWHAALVMLVVITLAQTAVSFRAGRAPTHTPANDQR